MYKHHQFEWDQNMSDKIFNHFEDDEPGQEGYVEGLNRTELTNLFKRIS
jgi:hypothetical protein